MDQKMQYNILQISQTFSLLKQGQLQIILIDRQRLFHNFFEYFLDRTLKNFFPDFMFETYLGKLGLNFKESALKKILTPGQAILILYPAFVFEVL